MSWGVRAGSIPLLGVWVVICQFVQASSYAYLGALAAFTPMVIVFGHQLTASGASLTAERYALAREEEIVIGVVIACLISSLLWPVSSIRLLRSEVMLSLEAFEAGLIKTLGVYEKLADKHQGWTQGRKASRAWRAGGADGKGGGGSQAAHHRAIARRADHQRRGDQPRQLRMTRTRWLPRRMRVSQPPQPLLVIACRPSSYCISPFLSLLSLCVSVLSSLLSDSSRVQLSLSRQTRLLGEVNSEPATFFSRFPLPAYEELMRIQRRIWSLVLTLEPALRDILLTQAKAAAEVEAELFDLPVMRSHIKALIGHIQQVLRSAVSALRTGKASNEEEVRVVVETVHAMEAGFSDELNDMARRVKEGRMKMMHSKAIVPVTCFLYSAVQLAEQVLVLEAAINRLLQLEQPQAYDD